MDEITMFAELRPSPPSPAEADAMRAAARERLETALDGPRRAVRQRRVVTAMIASTAAAAAGITIAAVATVGGRPPAPVSTLTTAYVVSHAEVALAGVTSQNRIEYAKTTTSGDLRDSPPVAFWSYRGDNRSATYNAAGLVDHDSGNLVVGHTETGTVVDYQQRTWSRTSFPIGTSPAPRELSCTSVNLPWLAPSDLATKIRKQLSCGQYKVAGTQLIDGVQALKLKQVQQVGGTSEVLWVNQATFLPVRQLEFFASGRTQTDIRWLQPTPANLADLDVPIPAGFTKVPG